jgi:hypothetical protein
MICMEQSVKCLGRNWKPMPAPPSPSEIPRDFRGARIRTAAVGSRPLTAWVTARTDFGLLYRASNIEN